MKHLKNNRCFTLVELAIVLVIIGIILSAVLKGHELINNAKIKRLYNQYREIVAAFYTYYGKYGKYPGDDPNAETRWPNANPATKSGNGNAFIDGGVYEGCTNQTVEACQAWYHMRLANILTGSGAQAPTSPYVGSIASIGAGEVQGLFAHWIAFSRIPGEVCQSIDEQYDDGVYNTGSIRGSGNYNAAPGPVYTLYFKLV